MYLHKHTVSTKFPSERWASCMPSKDGGRTAHWWRKITGAIGCRLCLVCLAPHLLVRLRSLAFPTITYFLHCVICSLQGCTPSLFRATSRERFQSSLNSSLWLLPDFIPEHQWLYMNQIVCDPVLSSLATKLQTNQICANSRDLQEVVCIVLWPTFSSLENKGLILVAHSLLLRTFCCSKVSLSSTPIQGWNGKPNLGTTQYPVHPV